VLTESPREPAPCVWCACWQSCGGMFVPGFTGRGGMLCEACNAKWYGEPAEPVAVGDGQTGVEP
jgi:hypothetical protein